MEKMRKWLILFRAHTAVLEAPLAVLGAALALGSLEDPILLGWLAFGMLYHYVGYGMNSYADWKKGFDKDDPRKQHHPLNKGTIEPDKAKKVIFGMFGLLIVLGIALGGLNIITLGCLAVMIASGVSYNYFGKVMTLKFIPIAVVHTMVFVFPYLVYADTITIPFILITAAYFVHHTFQIVISGDVKDIDQDEASLIKELGADVGYGVVYDDKFEVGTVVMFMSFGLCILQVALATSGTFLLGNRLISEFLIILFGFWMFYETDKIVETGPFNREDRVLHMSRKEIAGYLMVHSAVVPVVGLASFVLVPAFMLGYLLTTSKYMWGNWIKPEV
jgi:4-hydroxybenzoate polyprenyltransferase